MLKITALNEDSSEEDEETEGEGEEEVTKEALEEIAMQQYGKTLELQKKGKQQDALELLKQLLDTELLYDVKKSEKQQEQTPPLLKLKYLCYKNIGSISAQQGDKENAVNAYLEASYLDDTDITLWYRLGKLSLDLHKYDLALFAFQRGIDCNSKHWPCLDHLVTLLLGLGQYNECIVTIYNALQLDNEYLRGKAYRKYIFTDYPHVQSYLAMLNPIYKWKPSEDEDIDDEECKKFVKEATDINEIFIKQVMETNVPKKLPVLSLNKPIENLTWLSVGESIVDMHMHISEKLLSHACIVKVSQPEEKNINTETEEAMDVDVPISKPINGDVTDSKLNADVKIDDKVIGNDLEKMDVDQDTSVGQEVSKVGNEIKDLKKSSRRRGSSVRFLQQWEWCNKRKSSRKKTNKPEQETLYEILRKFLPSRLKSEDSAQQEQTNKVKEFKADDSMDTMDLYKLFEEKERSAAESNSQCENKEEVGSQYFNTEKEQTAVQAFIQKYVDSTCDIITMVDDFVLILSKFWDVVWPEGLSDIYMEANWCSRQHSDPPLGYVNEENVLKNFIKMNIMHLEVGVNKLLVEDVGNGNVEMELIDVLRILCARTEELGDEATTLTLRYLWVKCHSFLYKNQVEFALDCLYYILDKLFDIDTEDSPFSLRVVNFTKCPIITKNACQELIKSLERNKLLSTVPGLFESGKYDDVMNILQDSFKHCQILAAKQDWKGMSLDWAVQLMMIMESLWGSNDTEQCFIWSTVCLRESFKQYTLCEQGSSEIDKWSLVVVKALVCIEHILSIEGSLYLDVLSEKSIVHLIQDVIQIIVHQLDETNNTAEMPLSTVVCWIILHYVYQREEDCGRMPKKESPNAEMPISLLVLFLGHENLGRKGWCTINESKLLIFTLKAFLCRLRSPAFIGVVEIVSQYLEQCVLCLFGHPKKIKVRYLADHNATPVKLDWEWAQLIFDLYRPEELPEFNSYRLSCITGETEQLFQNVLSLAPTGIDPHPHYSDVIAFIEGRKSRLPHANLDLPFRMRDIYYLLADYYFKNNETVKALKYYVYDIIVCRRRFDSWAGMALARGSILETKLNSCESFRNEMEYLNRATAVEFCFKQALEIDSSHSMLWIEYGCFVYGVHSFCSRMLKQASESLSMESFEVLENRKESMLDTASKCFIKAHRQWMEECQGDDKAPQDERWLHYYMLGKISEKKNDPPQKYLDLYLKAATFLQQNNATYPGKINYSNPQNLSVEALEIQYRLHASILKYIEQHENKVICIKDGKCFKEFLEKCSSGPFSKKKGGKESSDNKEQSDSDKTGEANVATETNINQDGGAKRPCSEIADGKDGSESKKAKVEEEKPKEDSETDKNKESATADDKEEVKSDIKENLESVPVIPATAETNMNVDEEKVQETKSDGQAPNVEAVCDTINQSVPDNAEAVTADPKTDTAPVVECEQSKVAKESDNTSNTATSKDNTSSDSSSDSSSSDSSSSSSSSSSSDSSGKQSAPTEFTQDEISQIITTCLNSLEDCVSRFPQHYKALYRLAHFHFYYKKEKNIQRCRDLMLGTFVASFGSKLQGLFCERKNSNFFNSIWRIPVSEVDRPGSFATHMSRCVLITMEILKELDDHKTLLDLSLQLQKTPEADKKYLRESERIELFQQALSLCTRSIKGQLNKFHKVDDLSSTTPEKQEVANFMVDLYKIFQKIQKNLPTKTQTFASLLIDCYKIYSGRLDSENLLDKCVKKCHSIMAMKRQQAQQAAQAQQTPPPAPTVVPKVETPTTTVAPASIQSTQSSQTVSQPPPPKKAKPVVSIIPATSFLPHVDSPMPYPKLPNPFLSYLPMMDRTLLSAMSYDQAAAAMYLSNMSNLAGVPTSPYQADLMRQMMSAGIDPAYLQAANLHYGQSSSSTKPKTSSTVSTTKTTTNYQSSKLTSTASSTKTSSSYVTPSQKITSEDMLKKTTSQPGVSQSVHNRSTSTSTHAITAPSSSGSSNKIAQQSTLNSSNLIKTPHSTSSSNIKPTLHSPSAVTSSAKPQAHQPQTSTKSYQSTSTTSNTPKPVLQSSSVKPAQHSPSSLNTNVKSAHHTSSVSNIKPARNSPPFPSGNVKSTHHSTSSLSGNVRPTHQSPSIPSSSVKQPYHTSTSVNSSVKPIHHSPSSLSNSGKSLNTNDPIKSAHRSFSSTSTSAKPAHQSINTAIQSKSSTPSQPSNSSGKTLQEKLAERQKQNPKVNKYPNNDNSSNKNIQAFAGKLPSSLTITKTSSASKPTSSPHSNSGQRQSSSTSSGFKPGKVSHNPLQYGEKLAQPKKPIDSSEVIVLDDD